MIQRDAIEYLEFLGRSRCRVIILASLREDGPLHRRDFDELLDVARTTLTRNLDALIERGLVRRENRTYRLTPVGGVISSELVNFVKTVSAVTEIEPLVKRMPPSESRFDPLQLAEGTLTVSTPDDPYAPVSTHIKRIRISKTVRCLLPAVGLRAMKAAKTSIIENQADHEIVVTERVARSLQHKTEYVGIFEELRKTGNFTALVSEREIPYYLGLLDDTVQIGVSENGVPRALLEVQSDDVWDSACQMYDAYRGYSTIL
jgi:predicted transcriptional regulator